MSLLKTVISELSEGASPGSTSAGSIANIQGSLFGGGHVQPKFNTKRKSGTMIRRLPSVYNMPYLKEAMGIDSGKTKFNAADVVSKLDAAEKKAKNTNDTTAFGMEDDNGNIVKVHVRADQADQFERALAAGLGNSDDNSDDKNSSVEIAEVLFNLKDKFDIIDVDWGDIQGDEEEEQEVQPSEQGAEGGEQQPGMEGGAEGAEGGQGGDQPGMEGGADMGAAGGGEEDVKSLLTQVVDVLKSQAQAQKAEADARTAEAKAKEAEYAAKAAETKVKQEEEVLDMESYYKDQTAQKKEAQRLAKLAKFKHDKAKEADETLKGGSGPGEISVGDDMGMGGEEQEEKTVVSPRELAAAIFRQLKGK